MATAFQQPVKAPMRDASGDRSIEDFKQEGYALIRNAKIPEYEKDALTELMNELLTEGFSTPAQIIKRIRAAIQVNESLVPEVAQMEKEIDSIFHSR